MSNGIFLGTSVIDGVPTLFQYTVQLGTPVVLVERFNPSREELLNPTPVEFSREALLSSKHHGVDSARHLVERLSEDAIHRPISGFDQDFQGTVDDPKAFVRGLELKGVHVKVIPDSE